MNLGNNGALLGGGGPPSTTNTTDPASIAGPLTVPEEVRKGISNRHPKGWGHVPKALSRSSVTTSSEIAVYNAIAGNVSYTTGRGDVWLRRIWEDAHVSRKTAWRAVHSLEARGYLKMWRRPGQPFIFQLMSTDPDKQFDVTLNDAVMSIGMGATETSNGGRGGIFDTTPPSTSDTTPQRSTSEKALFLKNKSKGATQTSSSPTAARLRRQRQRQPKAKGEGLTEEEVQRRKAAVLRRLESMAGYKEELAAREEKTAT